MSPALQILAGLTLLALFGWYFLAAGSARKRLAGLLLTLFVAALCWRAAAPPFDLLDADGRLLERGRLRLGLDLRGGTAFVLRLARGPGEAPLSPAAQERAVEVIRARIDRFDLTEPLIAPLGTERILVQIPGLDPTQIEAARLQLQRVARLEFRLVHPQSDALCAEIDAGRGIVPPGYRRQAEPRQAAGEISERSILVQKIAALTGDRVVSAHPVFETRGWGVVLRLDAAGARAFGDLTSAHLGERLAIVLDGQVQSAPVLESAIYNGVAQISGSFTEEQARDLASALENPLQTPLVIEEERSVSASLGLEAVRGGVFAALAGLLATFVAVAWFYRLAGWIANFALLLNGLLLLGAMAHFQIVLTLPGLAGVVLTLGIAIDANVLIYERLREELAAGRPLRSALGTAYEKAFGPIFDAHVTQILTSAVLILLASGPVRGFAVALALGIACSLFSSLLVTRTIFAWALDRGGLQRLRLAPLPSPSRPLAFQRHARTALLGALAVAVISLGAVAWRGRGNLGLEFRGGDLLVVSAQPALAASDVRGALERLAVGQASVQLERQSDGRDFVQIRAPFETATRLAQTLQDQFRDRSPKVERLDRVGPLVGQTLAWQSAAALVAGLLGIFVYLAFRFETAFALGAVVALVHDLVAVVGVFALSGREMNLVFVGALLTVAGYSVNDTVVVFDRIRSLRGAGRPGRPTELADIAIQESLSRTLLTAGMTLLSVLALLVFGGPVLRDFALALAVGIGVGTFSSIYIATPVALWWGKEFVASCAPSQ
ncbi:MAG: protein translocase subunit SecD [Verrucomicrobia bacterium]|nr:protein translocase subunit SecD [Verrucomicrobiota bacterium]